MSHIEKQNKTEKEFGVTRRLLATSFCGLLICSFGFFPSAFSQPLPGHQADSAKALPATAQEQISAVLGRSQRAYQATAKAKGFRIDNPKHALAMEFTAAGVRLRSGTANWGLTLQGYGYGDHLLVGRNVAPRAAANRVEYRRGALTEWYVNGPLGLEQGFNLARSPGKNQGEPLTLSFVLSGDLTASVDPTGRGLTLKKNGVPTLRYSGLTARDMTGRELRAWMEATAERLWLRVDDTGALYPLVVDPIVQLSTFTASDGKQEDLFGGSVAVSGDTIVVGAPSVTGVSNFADNAAYIFVKPTTGWSANATETAKLSSPNSSGGSGFGASVGIDGDTIVVGQNHFGPSAAYVFVKPPAGSWLSTSTADATLNASDAFVKDQFGHSVAISGDTVVVGAYTINPDASNGGMDGFGAAYVFVTPAGGWGTAGTPQTENAKLVASDRKQDDDFGYAVAISGDTVVVGAPGPNQADYVFEKPVGGWGAAGTPQTETAKLTAADGGPLGISVAINSDTIAAGEGNDTVGTNVAQGSVCIFVQPAAGWQTAHETAKLIASDGAAGDFFGYLVAVNSDAVIALAGSQNGVETSAAYAFAKPVAGWSGTVNEAAKVVVSVQSDGYSGLALDGTTMVLGSQGHKVGSNLDQGEAQVYDVSLADFSLSVPALTIPLDTPSTKTATIRSLNQFAGTVSLGLSPRTVGLAASASTAQVGLSAGGSATSTLKVAVAANVTPRTFTLTLTGISGTISHSVPVKVTVAASPAGITNVVESFQSVGCVDSAEANALTVALATVQSDINAHNITAAETVLAAIVTQIRGKGASHFTATCGARPATFSPASVVITDVQSLDAALHKPRLPL
jgi:hypothetical protein